MKILIVSRIKVDNKCKDKRLKNYAEELIKKIGGSFFDYDYVILNDDVDSSLRIWLAGYKIVYVPTCVVLHKRSATMKNLPVEFVAFHGRKNIIQTIIKNYDLKSLAKWLPVTLLIYIGATFYYLTVKRPDQVKATINAILWNVKNLKRILQKRKYIQKFVKKGSHNTIFLLMKPFSITELVKGEKLWPR